MIKIVLECDTLEEGEEMIKKVSKETCPSRLLEMCGIYDYKEKRNRSGKCYHGYITSECILCFKEYIDIRIREK